jgi:hypothetical protein
LTSLMRLQTLLFGLHMMRSVIFAALLLGVLAYLLVSRGGHSESGSFHAGNLYGAYEIHARGHWAERLGYLVLSENWPDVEYEGAVGTGLPGQDAPFRFAYRFPDGSVAASQVQLGQTVWIGADRKAHVIPPLLTPAEVRLLQERSTANSRHLASPQDVQTLVATLKAEPDAAPNAASPHR